MNRNKLIACGMFALLVGLGVASRLAVLAFPWVPPNFQAIAGTALFAGFFFRSRSTAAAVPLVAMVASDLVLGGYELPVMVAVYASLAAPIAWRGWLRRRTSAARVAGATVFSTLLFFAATNLAVWYAWYPQTAAGLGRCYVAALPFLVYSLSGDLLFAGVLFGGYAWATASRGELCTAEARPLTAAA